MILRARTGPGHQIEYIYMDIGKMSLIGKEMSVRQSRGSEKILKDFPEAVS